MVEQTFDPSYGGPSAIRLQRPSLIPKIPQLEGIYIPSPDVNPHLMSLIKLILFKPFHDTDAVDDKGNALDPYKELYELPQTAAERQKRQLHENPYDVFPAAWQAYWEDTVLPNALKADAKLSVRMEWPTIWECKEVFEMLKSKSLEQGLIQTDEDYEAYMACIPPTSWPIALLRRSRVLSDSQICTTSRCTRPRQGSSQNQVLSHGRKLCRRPRHHQNDRRWKDRRWNSMT